MSTTMEVERRISYSQADIALLDEFVADVQSHAMQGLQNPGMFPERQMLQVILTDATNLQMAIQRGRIE